jgi:hypothetical protein
MSEFFTSILDSYKSKIRNPFFGTLFTVWIIRNWIVVYALFNFDVNYTMQDKLDFIADHFVKKDFWNEFLINISCTFLLLIITYILLAGTRFLTDLYYKRCEPYIVTKIDKNAILTEKDKVRLEKRIIHLSSKVATQAIDISSSEESNKSLLIQIESLKNEYKEIEERKEERFNSLVKDHQKRIGTINSFGDIIKDFNETIKSLDERTKNQIIVVMNHNNIEEAYNELSSLELFTNKGYFIEENGSKKVTLLGKSFFKYFDNYESIKE